ncbi:MAG: twin-arginine translocation signal domain-containing protein [Opitutaceae bacterium]|nr:twin-arginine translocation signal domain-containing protein [Opitutaceae bacterium]
MNRRQFIERSAVLGLGVSLGSRMTGAANAKTTQLETDGFFTLGKRKDHWWLITPEGKPFFTMGLNHIDPASLRYPENVDIWKEKYKGSTLKWIQESVSPNLKEWGFNTVGWVQEVTVPKWQHSRPFTVDEYSALDMPYCHLLPFTESHQWEKHTVHYDFRSDDWKEWCDYVARSHCAELNEHRNLIGYFYSDCPTWVHQRPDNEWRGPIFDPERLKTEAGRKELTELAHAYYKTTHDAIRRYDKNHLILGDRYEANAPIPMEVVNAALPFVDVLSFQDFRDPVTHLDEWYKKTGKPVLLADAAGVKGKMVDGFKPNNGPWYSETLDALYENPGCIGFHLCGAYQRNKARRRGLLDERENPDQEHVEQMTAANKKIAARMAKQF